MPESYLDRFNQIVTRHRRKADVMEMLRDILAEEPSFADELSEALGLNGNGHSKRERGPSLTQRVLDWYRQNDNPWATMQDIAEGVGTTPDSARQIVYKRVPDAFEKRKHPEHSRMLQWRLKQDDDVKATETA